MIEERMLRWFVVGHLPPDLAQVSGRFAALAQELVGMLAAGPERTVALRKLLEAKDAAVRAALEQQKPQIQSERTGPGQETMT